MQAISPQEVVANSPKLSVRLTMVGLDVSGMREVESRCRSEDWALTNLEEHLIAISGQSVPILTVCP